jgi:hypothetical protein
MVKVIPDHGVRELYAGWPQQWARTAETGRISQRVLPAGICHGVWPDTTAHRASSRKSFLPAGLQQFQRRAPELAILIREAFLRGLSTRQVPQADCRLMRRCDRQKRGRIIRICSTSSRVYPRWKLWSGWQELNLRRHVPKTCGGPLHYTRICWGGLLQPPPVLAHAHHLPQCMHHINQITLCFHHGVNGLVRHRSFINDVRILTALNAGSRLGVIVQREAAPRFCTRHGASGSMATAHEAFRIALAAHDVRTRTHAARDNAHVSLTSTHCALAGDEHVLAVVVLPGHVVVMAAHDRDIRIERWAPLPNMSAVVISTESHFGFIVAASLKTDQAVGPHWPHVPDSYTTPSVCP